MMSTRVVRRGAGAVAVALALSACSSAADVSSNFESKTTTSSDQTDVAGETQPQFTVEQILELPLEGVEGQYIRWEPWFGGFALYSGSAYERSILGAVDAQGTAIELRPLRFHSPEPFAEASITSSHQRLPGSLLRLSSDYGDERLIELLDWKGSTKLNEQRIRLNDRLLFDNEKSSLGAVRITPQGRLAVRVFDTATLNERIDVSLPLPLLPHPNPRVPRELGPLELLDAQLGNGGSTVWVAYRNPDFGMITDTTLAGFNLDTGELIAITTLAVCLAESRFNACAPQTEPVILNMSDDGERLWAVLQGERVIVVNPNDGTVVGEITNASRALGIGVGPDPSDAWLLQGTGNLSNLTLTEIDTATLTLTGDPMALPNYEAFDPKTAGESINSLRDKYGSRFGVRFLGPMVLAADRSKVWFTGLDSYFDLQIATATGDIQRQAAPGRFNFTTAIDADGARLAYDIRMTDDQLAICIESLGNALRLPNVWEPCAAKQQITIPASGRSVVPLLTWSPDNQRLFVLVSDAEESPDATAELRTVDVQTMRVLNTTRLEFQPNQFAFRPNGGELWLTRSDDARIMIVDGASGALSGTIDVGAPIHFLTFAPDGSQVVAGVKVPSDDLPITRWIIIDPASRSTRGTVVSRSEARTNDLNFGWSSNRPQFGENPAALYVFNGEGKVTAIGPQDPIPAPSTDEPRLDQAECALVTVLAVTPDPERIWVKSNCGELAVVDAQTLEVIESTSAPNIDAIVPIPGAQQVLAFHRDYNPEDPQRQTFRIDRISW